MGIKHHPLPIAVRGLARKACAALAVSALSLSFAANAQAAEVPTLRVSAGIGGSAFEAEGVIQPQRQATVAAQVAGNVVLLAVKAGDRVKAGQLLARIDERDTAAGLQRSDAALAQAQAEALQARQQVQRTRELRTQGFVSQAALDTAEAQHQAAAAGVAQAQAGRTQATLARGFASVLAPFDGVVLATHVEGGDLAAPGRPIATVYAPGALRAVVQVGLSRAAAVRAATQATVLLPGGQTVTPVRRTELASADPVSQTVEWRFDLPAEASGALPGQSVSVRFSGPAQAAGASAAQASAVPRLPAAAVLRRGELVAVYVVQGNGFVLRAVRLGADRGAEGVDVVAGLKPGERVAAQALQAGLAGATPAP